MARQLTALGGAIFAGLFTVGIKEAGYRVLGHLEFGDYGVATARKNFPDLDIRVGTHNWNPERFTGKVDFMYTNPPCAAWSTLGHPTRKWHEQTERLSCVQDLVQAGLIVQPKAWCWESVTGAWGKGREFVLEQARIWNQHGYHVTVLLQNNMYLGCPQFRKRMFLIAHKHPIVWMPFVESRTTGQILKQMPKRGLPKPPLVPPPLSPRFLELWHRSDGHGRLRRAYEQMSEEELAKHPGIIPFAVVRRLNPDKPPPVFLQSAMRLHPTEPREFTYHEWLEFTGLPHNWQTACTSFNSFSLELSRAVMPPVGRWLGESIAAGLKKKPLDINKGVTTRVVNFMFGPERASEEELWRTTEFADLSTPVWSPATPPPEAPKRVARIGAPPRAPSPGRPGIGARIRDLLQDPRGFITEQILTTIRQEFPQSKATAADVSWNRGKLKKEQQRAA
jgi:site-specific DNA-cytosine methylase